MKKADPRSDWAEAMPEFGPDTQIYEGAESRAALAELLDDAPAADEYDVTRRLRGRPSLSRRGTASRQLHVRIGEDLSALVDTQIKNAVVKNESELVRVALTEYFRNHPKPT